MNYEHSITVLTLFQFVALVSMIANSLDPFILLKITKIIHKFHEIIRDSY